jgi:hypothetical protein
LGKTGQKPWQELEIVFGLQPLLLWVKVIIFYKPFLNLRSSVPRKKNAEGPAVGPGKAGIVIKDEKAVVCREYCRRPSDRDFLP